MKPRLVPFCLAVLTAFGLQTAGVGGRVALADPVNAPGAISLPITCGDQTFTYVIKGTDTIAHVVGSNSVLIGMVATLTYPDGSVHTFTLGQGVKVGLQGTLVTCTGTFPGQGGTVLYSIQELVTPHS